MRTHARRNIPGRLMPRMPSLPCTPTFRDSLMDGFGVLNEQVQLLQAELKPSYPFLEINTIDKYQGRDKKVIVVSFVRSNAEGTVGHLLRDWRRLNVALSRAKHKLLLVGSLRTLSSCAILNSLADILETRGWVYPLPPGAHRTYPRGLGLEVGGREVLTVAEVATPSTRVTKEAGGVGGAGGFRRSLPCGGGGGGSGGAGQRSAD